ncbi:MAG TPA: hypothetical protein DCY55_13415, partial [Gammaproteobacteria bacterium]|nr:hypothetical protein [Gammaproteobacteria bacterium]
MKAMVLQSPETLVQGEIENPTIEAGNTLIKITHSGVCGTDLKIYQGGIPVDYPRIMGHEMIGEVAEVGDAEGVEIGSRVIIDPVVYCGHCYQCQRGQTQLCPTGAIYG